MRKPAAKPRSHPDPANLKNPPTATRSPMNANRGKRANVIGFLKSETDKKEKQYNQIRTAPIVYKADVAGGVF